MVQLCGKEIILPLQLLFKSMLEEGIFPEDWKRTNVEPVHKIESTNLIKNYRPISLFPIFSKIFERLVLILCLITLYKVNFLHSVSQVSYLVTHAFQNCCQLHMKSVTVLIITHQQLTRWEFFLIFRKLLIQSGMKV